MLARLNKLARYVWLGAALGAVAPPTTVEAGGHEVSLLTGRAGGSWDIIGREISRVVREPQIVVRSGSDTRNVVAVARGEADLAFSKSVSTVDAINGRPPFRRRWENVCHLANLYQQIFLVATYDRRGIDSIDDLRGRALTTQWGSRIEKTFIAHLLQAAGLSNNDLSRVDSASNADPESLHGEANTDVFTLVTTIPEMAPMNISGARDIRLLDMTNEQLQRITELNSGYHRISIPAGFYRGQREDVHTIGYTTHLIARCDLANKSVQTILRQIVDHQWELASAAKGMGKMSIEQMGTPDVVPMHPAAKSFYLERGWTSKEGKNCVWIHKCKLCPPDQGGLRRCDCKRGSKCD